MLTLALALQVSVINCVSGDDTLEPAAYVARTLDEWQAHPNFAGVPLGPTPPPADRVDQAIEDFLERRSFLGRELILIHGDDPGRVIEVRPPGVACLIRTGVPTSGRGLRRPG